jgi:cell division septation protein DedD
VPNPEPGTTLLEDLGGDDQAAAPPASGDVVADAEDEEADPTAPGDEPPVNGGPVADAGTAGAAGAAAGGEPAATAGQVFIQVFSSSDRAQALRVTERLKGQGFGAFISPVRVGAIDMYRVRVGPYDGDAEAKPAADRIRRRFKLDTWITR